MTPLSTSAFDALSSFRRILFCFCIFSYFIQNFFLTWKKTTKKTCFLKALERKLLGFRELRQKYSCEYDSEDCESQITTHSNSFQAMLIVLISICQYTIHKSENKYLPGWFTVGRKPHAASSENHITVCQIKGFYHHFKATWSNWPSLKMFKCSVPEFLVHRVDDF